MILSTRASDTDPKHIGAGCPVPHAATIAVRPCESFERTLDVMMKIPQTPAQATTGRVLHGAGLYDLLAFLLTRGRERQLRERMMQLARLDAGDTVLDVGCGTGTLAIAAKVRVGTAGAVFGIDASPAMVARATSKSGRAGIDVTFSNAVVPTGPPPMRR